jgi:hypothetical protein
MPDTLHDGSFLAPITNGPRRYEYPFRMNGDRVSALFEQEYWQAATTFTPTEWSVPHPTEPEFYLVKETEPVEFMAGLVKYVRTFARVPARQTEWNSILVQMPEPTTSGGLQTLFGPFVSNGNNTSNQYGGGILAANYFFGLGAYYRPLKTGTPVAFSGNRTAITCTNHSLTNGQAIVMIGGSNISVAAFAQQWDGSQWSYINANAINGPNAFDANYMGLQVYLTGYSRGSFGSGSRYLRCRRVTDFYLPGITPGITTEADIPLPSDQSNSSEFIDALLAGGGDINVQVGELTRWRGSPIYQITKTVIDVLDIL